MDYDAYLIASTDDRKPTKPNVINTMLLFETQQGDYAVYLTKIYPDDPDTELNKKDFDKLSYGDVPKDFSGQMMFFDGTRISLVGLGLSKVKRQNLLQGQKKVQQRADGFQHPIFAIQ